MKRFMMFVLHLFVTSGENVFTIWSFYESRENLQIGKRMREVVSSNHDDNTALS